MVIFPKLLMLIMKYVIWSLWPERARLRPQLESRASSGLVSVARWQKVAGLIRDGSNPAVWQRKIQD